MDNKLVVIKTLGLIEHIFEELTIQDSDRKEVKNNLLNAISVKLISAASDNPDFLASVSDLIANNSIDQSKLAKLIPEINIAKHFVEAAISVLTDFVSIYPAHKTSLIKTINDILLTQN